MSTELIKIPFLVVAYSPFMRGMLKFVLETVLHTDVVELESEEKALLFLKKTQPVPSLIIYDYSSNAYLLEDFVAHLKTNSKDVKIIILVDKVREEAKLLLRDMHQMVIIDEHTMPKSLLEEARKSFEGTSFINKDPYCRVDINFLSILDGINKNLFLKIGTSKYIKISNENEAADDLDIKKYKEKGINYLYIERETALRVISQIQNQIEIFLNANNFKFVLRGASDSPEKRFEQKILRINDEVHVDKEFKASIDKTVDRIRSTIEKEEKVLKYIDNLKKNQIHYAFFTQKLNLTSFIASVLAKELDWISKTTLDKLVFASVLSDITLALRPELLKIRSRKEFEQLKQTLSVEDQKIYLSHPVDGGKLLKRYFQQAPSDTDTLVSQHHEMPDGSGFPLGIRADKISPLSALFIIANDFSFYYLTDEEPTLDDYILKCNTRYDYLNFRKIIKALEKIKKK